jgi:hypothetical protein
VSATRTRNGKLYGYLWTEAESGKRSPRRFPLNNEEDGFLAPLDV